MEGAGRIFIPVALVGDLPVACVVEADEHRGVLEFRRPLYGLAVGFACGLVDVEAGTHVLHGIAHFAFFGDGYVLYLPDERGIVLVECFPADNLGLVLFGCIDCEVAVACVGKGCIGCEEVIVAAVFKGYLAFAALQPGV